MTNKFKSRETIKRFTAHNGKLGYNWDKTSKKYVQVQKSQQFSNNYHKLFMANADKDL